MSLPTGRKPPHSRLTHPRVVLDVHADLDVMISSVPAVVDRTTGVHGWPMYGNDTLSDCGEAGAGHSAQAITAWAGQPVTPSDQDVITLYETVAGYNPADPSTDAGTNLQDLLTWWSGSTWAGIELKGFAELRNWDTACLRACAYYFGTVYVGVNLPASAQDQFGAAQPWTVVPGSAIDGGHCIVLEDVSAGLDELHWITWGQVQRSNQKWWRTYAEEAWVLLTQQVLDHPPPGVDMAGVMSAYNSLISGG